MKTRLMKFALVGVASGLAFAWTWSVLGLGIAEYKCFEGERVSMGCPSSTEDCFGDCTTTLYDEAVAQCIWTGNPSDTCEEDQPLTPAVQARWWNFSDGCQVERVYMGEACLCRLPEEWEQPHVFWWVEWECA